MTTSKAAGRQAQPGQFSLGQLIHSNEDLNKDVNHLLSESAKEELEEHLNDLIASALEEEAEQQVFVASYSQDQSDADLPGSADAQGQATQAETSQAAEPADVNNESSENEEAEKRKSDRQKPEGPRRRRLARGSLILSPACREGAIEAMRFLRLKKLREASEGDKLEVQLGQIRYSQDSIMGTFRDGRKLKETREELESGKIEVEKIPRISVVICDNEVYSADNRRLWTFKHCGMTKNTRVPVIKKRPDKAFFTKLTTFSSGLSIARRKKKNGDYSNYWDFKKKIFYKHRWHHMTKVKIDLTTQTTEILSWISEAQWTPFRAEEKKGALFELHMYMGPEWWETS